MIMVQYLDISNVMLILSYLFDRKNVSILIYFFYYKLKRNSYGIVLSLKATVIIYIIHYYYSAN